ncbi:MAG: NAD-dependent epimerase/dehydratase family protein, partial [Planctomycetes bacterium]|nr:NAD-dependent epimerase/dehydratase family protein [Planctomycetota bacterium]
MIALVTGGGGFLGGAIVRRLVARGDTVRSFSRGPHPETNVEHHRGDIADAGAVTMAAAGCDIVFHVAAKAGVGMKRKDYVRANVTGTQNVLAACRANNIRKLVFTSSPSVTFDGKDQDGVDETAPYPRGFLCPYAETKAAAERLVLAANGPDLATVALRPHLIWGP